MVSARRGAVKWNSTKSTWSKWCSRELLQLPPARTLDKSLGAVFKAWGGGQKSDWGLSLSRGITLWLEDGLFGVRVNLYCAQSKRALFYGGGVCQACVENRQLRGSSINGSVRARSSISPTWINLLRLICRPDFWSVGMPRNQRWVCPPGYKAIYRVYVSLCYIILWINSGRNFICF